MTQTIRRNTGMGTSIMQKTGFDNERYIQKHTIAIIDRAKRFDNKLCLEFADDPLCDRSCRR